MTLTKSKTDQYWQGSTVLVAWSASGTCWVAIMEKYIYMYFRKAELGCHGEEYDFKQLCTQKPASVSDGRAISCSYTRVRELMKQQLSSIGLDAAKFGMHTFPAGEATAAANAGVPDCLFKRQWRWHCESAKDGYINESVKAHLSVPKKMI